MAIEPTKTEIVAINRGDAAMLTSTTEKVVNRAKIKNIKNFPRNIFAGDVVDKKVPSADYAYYWFREANDEHSEEELDRLTDAGYFFINTKDFDVKRWKPAPDGRVKSGSCYLMAIPKEKFDELYLERMRFLGAALDEQAEGFHAVADDEGFGTFEVRGGREREVVKPRKALKG